MLSKLKDLSYKYLWKDYASLKIFFIVLCGLVFIEELYVFFVKKPTLVKKIKEELSKEDNPDIILCPEPSVDSEKLRSLGYNEVYQYMSGVRYNSELTPIISGWRGNQTQSSVKDILRQVSYLKTIDDCGDAENSILIFERMHDNDYSNYEYIKYELTRGLYPNHICCKVSYSENARR